MPEYKLEYQRVLNKQRDATDPWAELANAIVEVAAEDYRFLMTKKLKRGLKMDDLELSLLDSKILDIKIFFESGWGDLCSRGLAPVIWEKLQAEFADGLVQFNIRRPFMQKHLRKIKRKRKNARERYRKNAARHKRQKKNRRGAAQEVASLKE